LARIKLNREKIARDQTGSLL